ncbi:MAG: sigma-70 family RNA polymerase sigma factor [Chloroflexota bacterium]
MLQSGWQVGGWTDSPGREGFPAGDLEAGPGPGLDRAALAALYRQHLDAVYRYFYSRVGNAQEAEDLTAATFAKMLASVGDYTEQGRFAAWLFTIARHTLADYQRRSREQVDLEPVAPLLADSGPAPEEAALRAERTRTLRRLLKRLPPDQQEALALRFFGQLSTAEVAAALGRSEGAVKMLVHRAILALRDLYAQEVQP